MFKAFGGAQPNLRQISLSKDKAVRAHKALLSPLR